MKGFQMNKDMMKNVVSEIGYTLSYLVGVACIFSLFFTFGCGASASGQAKSGDWNAAWKDGECVKTAGQEAYVACLERKDAITKEFPPPPPPQQVTTSATSATTQQTGGQTTVIVQRTEETRVVPQPAQPSLLPQQGISFENLQQITFGSGGFIFVPMATGAQCDLPQNLKPLQFKVENNTNYLLEVRGRLVPLNCEVGDKFIPARVLRNNKLEYTWVLKAGRTGRLVFLPLNGGMGSSVEVEIRSLMDLGDAAPAVPHGSVRKSFQVPAPDGGSWKWAVTPSMLR